MDLKTEFKNQIQEIRTAFVDKMKQNELCQSHELFMEVIIEDAKKIVATHNSIVELYGSDVLKPNPLLQYLRSVSHAIEVYDKNASDIVDKGKTYRNVLEEKIFTDGYRIFEEFLSSIFKSIFRVFPYLLVNDKELDDKVQKIDSKELKIPFQDIFEETLDFAAYKALTIENRVKTYMQSDNIIRILERFKSTFSLTMSFIPEKPEKNKPPTDAAVKAEAQLLECQRIALLRNIIAHNNSIINHIYIKSINSFKIKDNIYALDESLLPHLETEINRQRDIFKVITEQIIKDLESNDNLKTLDMKNTDNKNKTLNG